MKNYFTISESAKLRDININSLRYYEKIGILKPAKIDKENGYRYYSAEQLSLLNKIILCIQLGIPLKEMVQYLNEDGSLQTQKLLEQGRTIAIKRIQEMQGNLDYIEASLKNIEENKAFLNRKGVYSRYFAERKIITTNYYEGELDVKMIVSSVSEIYKVAQKQELFPILPAGQLLQINKNGQMRYCFFLEILSKTTDNKQYETVFDKSFSDKMMEQKTMDFKVKILPKGTYSCIQAELGPTLDITKLINENWKEEKEKTIIVNNVMLEKYSFNTRPSELQKWLGEKQT